MVRFTPTSVPNDLMALTLPLRRDYADCFQDLLTSDQSLPSVDTLARLFFSDATPIWVSLLLKLRNRMVAIAGLRNDDWAMVNPSSRQPIIAGSQLGPWRVVL